MRLVVPAIALLMALAPETAHADDIKQLRQEAANHKRRIIFNNDGDDVVYRCRAATAEDLLNVRTTALAGTQVDSIFYCTCTTGFGGFAHDTKVGQVIDTREGSFSKNVTRALIDAGTDSLRVMVEFGSKHGIALLVAQCGVHSSKDARQRKEDGSRLL